MAKTEKDKTVAVKEKKVPSKTAAKKPEKKIVKPSKVSSGSISMYLAEIGKFNPLPPEREVELAIRIQANDERAMKELVEANLRFVVSVAKKYQGNGLSLADAIVEMQSAGIAEANIANDVDGWDAAAKTAILANELLGAEITPHDVDREGLDTLQLETKIRSAQKRGRVIKLVASAKRTEGKILATESALDTDALQCR